MKLCLLKKTQQTSDVYTFTFRAEEPIQWQAGQYISVTLPDLPPSNNERTFTISAAPFEHNVAITTRITGSPYKRRLAEVLPGEHVEADQVGGDFVLDRSTQPVLLLAAGIGVTPFRSMIAQMVHEESDREVLLLYAGRSEEFVFKAELDAAADTRNNVRVTYIIGGRIDLAAICKYANELNRYQIYISGPEQMVDEVSEALASTGLSKDSLHCDWFPGYAAASY